jgi:hypothetical protein
MIDIEKTLHNFQISLCQQIDLAGLYARSHIAHKWKLTYRLIALREGIGWRITDILYQAHKLGIEDMIIGARILTRAAIETLCLLIYMNNQMNSVVRNKISFNDFEGNTRKMLLGAKNREGSYEPINVNGLVNASDKKYTGLKKIYDEFSETAHPNYEGISIGYSKLDTENHLTEFGNFWKEKFGNGHESAIRMCLEIFENEYNNIWPKEYKNLEAWLVEKDNKLERQRRKNQKNSI